METGPERDDLTKLLHLFKDRDPAKQEDLALALYQELHSLAESQMRRQKPGHTLQPTALVGELWAKLATLDKDTNWPSRGHFFKWVATVMANLLRDYARQKNSQKSGGKQIRISLDDCGVDPAVDSNEGALDILNAIEELTHVDPRLGSVVKMRAVVGMSYIEIADALEMSESQVDRSLQAARAWLRTKLSP